MRFFLRADVKAIPRKKADHIEDNGVPSWFIDGSIVQSNRRYSQNQFCQFFYTQNIHQRISSIWSVNPWSCKYFLPQSLNLRLGNTVLTLFPQAWCMQVNLQDWKGLALLLVHMCPIVSKLYIWLIIFYLVGKITFFSVYIPNAKYFDIIFYLIGKSTCFFSWWITPTGFPFEQTMSCHILYMVKMAFRYVLMLYVYTLLLSIQLRSQYHKKNQVP